MLGKTPKNRYHGNGDKVKGDNNQYGSFLDVETSAAVAPR